MLNLNLSWRLRNLNYCALHNVCLPYPQSFYVSTNFNMPTWKWLYLHCSVWTRWICMHESVYIKNHQEDKASCLIGLFYTSDLYWQIQGWIFLSHCTNVQICKHVVDYGVLTHIVWRQGFSLEVLHIDNGWDWNVEGDVPGLVVSSILFLTFANLALIALTWETVESMPTKLPSLWLMVLSKESRRPSVPVPLLS